MTVEDRAGADKSAADYKYSVFNSVPPSPPRHHPAFLTSPINPFFNCHNPAFTKFTPLHIPPIQGRSAMPHDGEALPNGIASRASKHSLVSPNMIPTGDGPTALEWDWDIEHADRKREAKADAAIHGAAPFLVDRKLLKDVVREKMDCEVGRISFIGAGTFHKGYLVTLTDGRELIARVARRFMPRLKTETEVATMTYIRTHTSIPIPTVYFYDSNPFNRLGGEYILMSKTPKPNASAQPSPGFEVGPIISWPFFGSNRGDLAHPTEIDRGPWSTTHAYFEACAAREIAGVQSENAGKTAPHRLHLDPDEILSSRHHHLRAVPGDRSDESDEWDWEDSEGECEGPGDTMYRDYRRMQRSTFLVSHLSQREDAVRREMARWIRMMERLAAGLPELGGRSEEFGLDLHDLSLENVFVDPHDTSKIVCPAFVLCLSFAHDAAHPPKVTPKAHIELAVLAAEWLRYEALGAPQRLAHRCVEWDGWEEGLVESILGPEDMEEQWIAEAKAD
ncbi:hypothetical protein EWM64_g7681, partial [Hericium alpestre]